MQNTRLQRFKVEKYYDVYIYHMNSLNLLPQCDKNNGPHTGSAIHGLLRTLIKIEGIVILIYSTVYKYLYEYPFI